MANKIPQLGSYPKGIKEVYDMIKNPEYVRETTRPANIIREIKRGTPSKVVRSAGYNKLFETFKKNGISKATINKFKSIPDIADFNSAKAYSEALKKFRNTAFKGLSNVQLGVIESSGFLSQYAKDQRLKMLKAGKNFDIKTLNKTLDQLFDYTFMTKESAVGVKKPKLQSKIYTQIRDMAKNTLNKAQRMNLDYALSQVDDLFKAGNVKKATKFLAAISTMVAKGAFARVPGLDLLITKEMGSGELTPEGIEEFKKDQTQARMNKRGGGLMDINHMTRPLRGYANGGDFPGNLNKAEIGELIDAGVPRSVLSRFDEILPGNLNRTEMDMLQENEVGKNEVGSFSEFRELIGQLSAAGVPREEILRIIQSRMEAMTGEDEFTANTSEDQLPYDPDKGYTENLNELMMDIGGTLKEKIKGAGSSIIDKIKDFAKYGYGDKENYMEIGGEQVDADDPNFRSFIENNFMGEGESYIEGIENYRIAVESGAIGEGFRRGGIVSLNHMTRAL